MSRLIVTCDEPPVPPLTGHNRKAHDVLLALRDRYEIHVVAYPRSSDGSWERYWSPHGVAVHPLTRRNQGRHWRALLQGLSLPTVTRDFEGEARMVSQLAHGIEARLLIDFLSGAPLVRNFGRGTVLSGHDCLSRLFAEESRHASSLRVRWRFLVRRRLALNAERRFAHLAERVHLVSEIDAQALTRVNPRARPTVIPIGGTTARSECLRPWEARRPGAIWGSLQSELIASGFEKLADALGTDGFLRGWRFYGRLPREQALARHPRIQTLGLEYHATMADVGSELGNTRVLLLPDIGGTGQKNRTMDGLAHGCCVVGLEEVFRGMEDWDQPPFVSAETMGELVAVLRGLTETRAAEIGRAARDYFAGRFSLPVLADQWRALFESVNPLSSNA
ncbi:MAG: hypothetical protein JNK85_21250 [Verrucomicrobiales bacterium]|nr:hypothetical protein [Verrucomicrobiales bacterium]